MIIHPDTHLIDKAQYIPSPNFGERPSNIEIDLLVLHCISMPRGQYNGNGIIELFTNRLDPKAHPEYLPVAELAVSSHIVIRRDGLLLQFVPLHLCAWHAGKSNYRGRTQCNDFSIGIELEGVDDAPFEPAQYTCLAELVRTLIAFYPGLSKETITCHSDIAPGRKTDPGEFFERDFLERY